MRPILHCYLLLTSFRFYKNRRPCKAKRDNEKSVVFRMSPYDFVK